MKIIKLFTQNKVAKTTDIKKRLIQLSSFMILFLIILNLIMYNFSMSNTYMEQMVTSNDSIVEQVTISHEMVLKYIKDSVYKTALYDEELSGMVQNYNGSIFDKQMVSTKLNSIVLYNEFIYSAYLYFPKYDQVFDTMGIRVQPLNTFNDKDVFDMIKDASIYTKDPHIIGSAASSTSTRLVISVLSSVPLPTQENSAFLVVNVDAKKLYYDILKKLKTEKNMNFYVFNEAKTVIISKNEDDQFSRISIDSLSQKIKYNGFWDRFLKNQFIITSTHYSDFLHWTFVLQTSINTPENLNTKLNNFFNYSFFLILFSLSTLIFIINLYTRPIKGLIKKNNENLWKDFLTDTINLTDEVKTQLNHNLNETTRLKYGTFVFQIQDHRTTVQELTMYVEKVSNSLKNSPKTMNINMKEVVISKSLIAIIMYFPDELTFEQCDYQLLTNASLVYNSLNLNSRETNYVGISTIKDSFSFLPVSYKECIEMFNYKLSFSSHIIPYSVIKDKKVGFNYPISMERQIINNILIGNQATSLLLAEEFFSTFKDTKIKIEDSEIKNNIYLLQNAIFKNISVLPIPVKIDCDIHIQQIYEIEKLEAKVKEYIEKICSEINKKDENDEYYLYNTILEYVEKNYIHYDFSLNKASDDLNINRNYVSKIIKEKTGENFTDYVNNKRISTAKELLQDKNKTVDDIAKEVGFNYSYYFIKIFKGVEGVTPGQYRSCINN